MSIQPGVEVLVVVMTTEIDHHTAVDFREELREGLRRCEEASGPSPEMVVDLSQVTFMDSTGIRELILAGHTLARRDGHLEVRGAQGVVLRCLEITGVLEYFGGVSTNGTGP
jgi:stage II sporulation protein AA (anti-sigma F factor antagonist)